MVKFMEGAVDKTSGNIFVSDPSALVTVREILYTPVSGNTMGPGFCKLDVCSTEAIWNPKSQAQELGMPDDLSAKLTDRPFGVKLNEATGFAIS